MATFTSLFDTQLATKNSDNLANGSTVTGSTISDALNNVTAQGALITGLGWFDVREYGALGDGSTNDYSAILDAITAAHNAGGGIVVFTRDTSGSGNNTFLVGTEVHLDAVSKVTFFADRATKVKKDDGLSNRVFDFGTSTWPASVTEPETENVQFFNMTFEGKGRVNAKYLGVGAGTLYTATYVSAGVVKVTGDVREIFTDNATVKVVNSGGGTIQDQIQVTGTSFASGETTITTNGTFTSSDRIQLNIDFSDNVIALKKPKGCSFHTCRFIDIGNGAVRATLVGEGILWNTTTYNATAADADTLTIDSADAGEFPVGAVVQVQNSGGTQVGIARVTVNNTTSLDVVVQDGTLTGAAKIARSFLDQGPFQGGVDFYDCYWENVAQPITTNDSGCEGVRVHPGCKLYRSGPFKMTSKSWTGKGFINGVEFRECGMCIWLQSAIEYEVFGNKIFDMPGVSEKEAMILHYNNEEIILTQPVRDIRIHHNDIYSGGNIYISLDNTRVSTNIHIDYNHIYDCQGYRGEAFINFASGKVSGFSAVGNTSRASAAAMGLVLFKPKTASGDTHIEAATIGGEIEGCTTGRAVQLTTSDASPTRNAKGIAVTDLKILSESSLSPTFVNLEDVTFDKVYSKTGFTNVGMTNAYISDTCHIETTLAAQAWYFGSGSEIHVNGGFYKVTNAGTSVISGGASATDVTVRGSRMEGNNRGVSTSTALVDWRFIGCELTLSASGLGFNFNGAAVRPMIAGCIIDAGGGTPIQITASPLDWILDTNFYKGGTNSITTGNEKLNATQIDIS